MASLHTTVDRTALVAQTTAVHQALDLTNLVGNHQEAAHLEVDHPAVHLVDSKMAAVHQVVAHQVAPLEVVLQVAVLEDSLMVVELHAVAHQADGQMVEVHQVVVQSLEVVHLVVVVVQVQAQVAQVVQALQDQVVQAAQVHQELAVQAVVQVALLQVVAVAEAMEDIQVEIGTGAVILQALSQATPHSQVIALLEIYPNQVSVSVIAI